MSKWICSRAALAALLAAGLISYTSSGQAGAQERPAAANQDDIGNPPADFGSDAKTEFRREPDAVERVLRGSTRVIADTAQAQGTDQQGRAQQQGAARAETAAQADRGGKTMPGDITLDQAHAALEAAARKAGEINTKMDIAIVDAGGNLKGFARMDGAWLGSIDISIKKAKTARYFDMNTGEIGKLSHPGGPLYGIEHSNEGLITFPGGVPIRDAGGTIIGAIGVSGSTVEHDHEVAMAGMQAVASGAKAGGAGARSDAAQGDDARPAGALIGGAAGAEGASSGGEAATSGGDAEGANRPAAAPPKRDPSGRIDDREGEGRNENDTRGNRGQQ